MRGHSLRELLHDIQSSISAAGAVVQAKALGQLAEAFKHSDEKSVDDISADIASAIADANAPAWEKHAKALKASALDERLFLQAIAAIQNDKGLKKPQIVAIAKDYGVRVEAKASVDRLVEQIKSIFYEQLYQRDADAMAQRATPW
ncbi:MAG: hypothetical protein HOO99_13010 [Hyphomicrobiaceae bacterium]|nr:hypothetical protein [Hyphomicrobium sp.]NOU07090.1 hypothetical protein [Hyphomicrobiaceae bacterium]